MKKMKRSVMLSVMLFALIAGILAVPDAGSAQAYRKRTVLIPLTARDVYISMYDLWGAAIFANISVSEQRHMDAVLKMLVKYRVPDPATGNPIGVFKNPDLQKLYDALMVRGRLSLLAALNVGKTIEETDIRDLLKALDETTKTDLDRVYGNLLNASYSHLRAFTSYL